jgi:hypothetical protein
MPSLIDPPRRNDPSIPTVYDAKWQFYVDLTQEQIAAYQAMPEWAAYCATQPVIANQAYWDARQAAMDTQIAAKATRALPPQ